MFIDGLITELHKKEFAKIVVSCEELHLLLEEDPSNWLRPLPP